MTKVYQTLLNLITEAHAQSRGQKVNDMVYTEANNQSRGHMCKQLNLWILLATLYRYCKRCSILNTLQNTSSSSSHKLITVN